MILNCHKYKDKRIVQLNTWIPKINIRWFHVIGNPELLTKYTYDESEHILYVQCKDTYEVLPMKTYLSVCAINELFPEVEYILKTDDDMKCNLVNFESMLNDIIGYDYGGQLNYCPGCLSYYHYQYVSQEFHVPFLFNKVVYCPGRFYFLSRKSVKKVLESEKYFKSQVLEDYAVGNLLSTIPDLKVREIDAQSIFYDT
jgi:hypothetical protein